ncbi:ABC transporter substrate-binding protein (plasmid) [Deinococcus aetherius]|uniref:ABC transporter substrate-binding protein n=1 Tax=Deinococcus aetherius TaxID=200252 RepID=A0ABM8AJ76_9DEIO|nr:ABC transporter substrate-binding protein [Deinococcus aetherius]BDP43875.1 ABC transporter substrate-binding protein [Deinococcus aetherius]
MPKRLHLTALLSAALAPGALAAPVVVGSKLDPEAQLLGQMIVLTLRNAGMEVTDKTALGDTGVNRKALLAGEIDVYPEYTGNAVYLFSDAKINPKDAGNPSRIYALARQLDAKNGVTWLRPANANNTWVVAVPRRLAQSGRLSTLADLARYLRGGGTFKIAGSPEFFDRPDTMPAFEKAYGFKLRADQKLVLAGATPVQTQTAASAGTSGVNAAMAYGTDGTLAALGLVALKDPLGVQPVYQPAPIIRTASLKADPRIEGLLNRVFAGLDGKTLQTLNGRIAVEGRSAQEVARAYLRGKGLIR